MSILTTEKIHKTKKEDSIMLGIKTHINECESKDNKINLLSELNGWFGGRQGDLNEQGDGWHGGRQGDLNEQGDGWHGGRQGDLNEQGDGWHGGRQGDLNEQGDGWHGDSPPR